MEKIAIQTGRIIKVVHVAVDVSDTSIEPARKGGHGGYGILRDDHGQDIFFIDSVVTNGEFHSLEVGQEVAFYVVPGPIAQASRVEISHRQAAAKPNLLPQAGEGAN